MTWSIDPPVDTASGRFFALSERDCRLCTCGTKLLGHGHKRPVIIILVEESGVSGVDMRGQHVSDAEIERRYPGALEALGALQ